ncbi:MAG TPA: hypothetical protein VI789_07935 [Dehalococcoidia bacterium]|nr:hypothetical protein [Dehalococcoidia bacterium]
MKLLVALTGLAFLAACAPSGVTQGTPTPPPPAPSPTATATPLPADAVDLNCDGSYERLITATDTSVPRPTPPVISITVEPLDRPAGGLTVYSTERADIAVLESPQARAFGGCEQLIVVPVRLSGSGSILQLLVFRWNGSATAKVLEETAAHGRWSASGARLTLTGAVYLFNEPNCCPCNLLDRTYAWDDQRFGLANEAIKPAEPRLLPELCSGTPVPLRTPTPR